MTKIEKWRRNRGYSHQELANILGCSRQYVFKLCKEGGTRGAGKIARLVALANGDLALEDFILEDDVMSMKSHGFLRDDTRPEETIDDELMV